MSTYEDFYGDTLTISSSSDDECVCIEIVETKTSACVEYSKDEAKQLALDLYELAGGTVSQGGPVLASNISFNEGVIRLAAIHGKEITFRYVKSASAAPETRRFVPSSVQGNGDSLRFVGRDSDREDFRSFRLDRIRGTVQVSA